MGSLCLLRPHFAYYFACLIFLRGGWGCRPSLGRCSAAALHRSRTVCCVPAACGADGSAIRRKRMHLMLLCVCSPVRSALIHGCLGGTQNARSRCCSGCVQLAVAHGFCLFRCMLRYCRMHGVLGAALSVSLRPNKFLCFLCLRWLSACDARMRLGLGRSVCVSIWLANACTRGRFWALC